MKKLFLMMLKTHSKIRLKNNYTPEFIKFNPELNIVFV